MTTVSDIDRRTIKGRASILFTFATALRDAANEKTLDLTALNRISELCGSVNQESSLLYRHVVNAAQPLQPAPEAPSMPKESGPPARLVSGGDP